MAKLCKYFYASWWFIILVRRWWFAEPVTSLIMCQGSHILITTVLMHLSFWYMCIANTSRDLGGHPEITLGQFSFELMTMMAMVRTRPIYCSSDAQTSSKRLPGGRCRACAWFILRWGCCSTFSCFFKSAKNNSFRRFRPKVAISVYRFPCCVLLALSWNTNLNEITEKLNIAIKSIVVQLFKKEDHHLCEM